VHRANLRTSTSRNDRTADDGRRIRSPLGLRRVFTFTPSRSQPAFAAAREAVLTAQHTRAPPGGTFWVRKDRVGWCRSQLTPSTAWLRRAEVRTELLLHPSLHRRPSAPGRRNAVAVGWAFMTGGPWRIRRAVGGSALAADRSWRRHRLTSDHLQRVSLDPDPRNCPAPAERGPGSEAAAGAPELTGGPTCQWST